MGKLILWNVVTLDGYFEGSRNWDLSFHSSVWGQELEQFSLEQLRSAAYLVFGRFTYEGMAAYWTKAEAEDTEQEVAKLMNQLPKLVVSKTLKSAAWKNTKILAEDFVNEIQKLKKESEKDIYVFGSANLSETFINENLFDEYRICIAPVILGNGRKLFQQTKFPKNLSLISSWQLKTGGVILQYAVN